MKRFEATDLQSMSKVPRLNLVNSCTGYKSANLIATQSQEGLTNLAVFSSITHLGSNPALLGFILRPTTVPRDTYKNIRETGFFTVNHIVADWIEQAHHTSASYDYGVSEFEVTGLEMHYHEGIDIPFVKGSPVQLYCKYLNEYPIHENDTIHIIASIETILVREELLHEDQWIQLDRGGVVAINGLDGYSRPQLIDRFAYARPNQKTTSLLNDAP